MPYRRERYRFSPEWPKGKHQAARTDDTLRQCYTRGPGWGCLPSKQIRSCNTSACAPPFENNFKTEAGVSRGSRKGGLRPCLVLSTFRKVRAWPLPLTNKPRVGSGVICGHRWAVHCWILFDYWNFPSGFSSPLPKIKAATWDYSAGFGPFTSLTENGWYILIQFLEVNVHPRKIIEFEWQKKRIEFLL